MVPRHIPCTKGQHHTTFLRMWASLKIVIFGSNAKYHFNFDIGHSGPIRMPVFRKQLYAVPQLYSSQLFHSNYNTRYPRYLSFSSSLIQTMRAKNRKHARKRTSCTIRTVLTAEAVCFSRDIIYSHETSLHGLKLSSLLPIGLPKRVWRWRV